MGFGKRGFNTAIFWSIILFVLIVIVAGIFFFTDVLNFNKIQQVKLGDDDVNMNLSDVHIRDDGIDFTLNVDPNKEEVVGVKFVFETDDNQTEVYRKDVSYTSKEKSSFSIDLKEIDPNKVNRILITPILKSDLSDSSGSSVDGVYNAKNKDYVNSSDYLSKVTKSSSSSSSGGGGGGSSSSSSSSTTTSEPADTDTTDEGVNETNSTNCTNQSYFGCYAGNVYWYNSCDEMESVKEVCDPSDSCQNAQCILIEDNSEPACGNNILESGEFCDGTSLGGETCIGLGYDSGSLSCSGSCNYDTILCVNNSSGDSNQSYLVNGSSNYSYYIVEEGVGKADIVVSDSAPNMVKIAAQYFQEYVNDITGVTLPINNAPNITYNFHVYIGESQYTQSLGITSEGCTDDGYKMVSGDGYLVLLGYDTPYVSVGPQTLEEWDAVTGDTWELPTPSSSDYNYDYDIWEMDGRGSVNAVYEFLYNQGMRWYYPGDIGTITPQKQDIGFNEMNLTVNPSFHMRDFYIYYKKFGHLRSGLYPEGYVDGSYEDYFKWILGLKENAVSRYIGGRFVHGLNFITSRIETVQEHPEYYAIWDGKLMNGQDGNASKQDLCSVGLQEETVRYIKAVFDNYDYDSIGIMPADGFIRASESSPECKARETPERGYSGYISDYVWEFINNVAWEIYNDPKYQDKMIVSGAYTAYQLPPLNLSKPMAPNIAILLTKWRSNGANDPETVEHFQNLTEEWVDFLPSGKVYTYDYYLINEWYSTTESIPAYFPHIISNDLQFLDGKSLGEHIEIYSNWPDYGLDWDSFAVNSFNVYVTSRLYWNPYEDVDALLEEYYNLYYGPAKNEMKTLVDYSEAHFSESREDPMVILNLRRMAEDALVAAGGDSTVYGQRVNILLKLINSSYIGEESYVDSCQYLQSASTVYKLTQDVSSDGTCFSILADNVTLDCQGHTITYSTGGGKNENAVYDDEFHTFSGDYFNISNCIIRDGSYLTGNDTGPAIYLYGADRGIVQNVNINVSGDAIFGYSQENTYINNVVNSYSGYGLFMQYGGYDGSNIISSNIIINNTFSSVIDMGSYLYRPNNDTLIGNTFHSVDSNGLRLFAPVNCLLQDNLFLSDNSDGYYGYDPQNLTLVNNQEING